jgi:hypothetical protein
MTRLSYQDLAARARNAPVVVTIGYSALGYEFPDEIGIRIQRFVQHVEDRIGGDDDEVLVVSGGTHDGGICDITYDAINTLKRVSARDRQRLVTVGLVSATAERKGVPLHPVDLCCVVEPSELGSWEVKSVAGGSLTVDVANQSSMGALLAFQGGEVAAKEVSEAIARGALCIVHYGAKFQPSSENVDKQALDLLARGDAPATVAAKVSAKVFAIDSPPGIYQGGRRISRNVDAIDLIPTFSAVGGDMTGGRRSRR